MESKISTEDLQGKQKEVNYFSEPDVCPICHFKLRPKRFEIGVINNSNNLQIMFQCTNQECLNLFIGSYDKIMKIPGRKYYSSAEYILADVNPKYPVELDISEEIKSISPKFTEIYTESYYIDSLNVSNLFGLGLRKALEFLIKDFCIAKKPEKKVSIINSSLSQCINNFIDDKKIRLCAERATWLGNDETHYGRIWIDKDIEDLKILIKLTINWIESDILTDKFKKEMPLNK